ncbi:hypothetical protein MB02_15905 [Croceicoccus estronivorus]|uniref:spinster family MFS transporter n=1 Tax=Croceicoccus estronivorus TaxID=1172626 RepID=UPI00083044AB|nr:MFS transporter [Croceicoccus estronivorus]OCC22609.1 hypothetical protein MB02_15905 [Croceicoccus estronivorus]
MKQSEASPPSTTLTSGQANFALAVFLLAYVLSFVDRQILSLMVDPIRQDLGLSDIQIGLLQGFAFAILYATMGVPFGMLADRASRRKLIAAGIVFWSFATAMCGLARSFAHLFIARIGVGVGEAALSPAAHSYLSNAFPREKLARAMAIYNLGITLGGGMALIIGGSVVALIARSGNIELPFFGELRSWQTAFLAVSLPGIFIALLALATKEPPRPRVADTEKQVPPLGDVFRNLWAHRRAFASIHFSSAVFGIYGYSLIGWYPTLMIRSFDLTPGQAGTTLGLYHLFLGSLGSICGGMLADKLAAKGRFDSNMRVISWIAAAVVIPATLTPLMPNITLLLIMLAPAVFLFNGYFGCSVAAIQLASPPSMRGTNAALFLLTNSFVGLTIGMLAVPMTDKYMFGGTGELGPALGVIAAVGCTLAGLIARSGLKQYGDLAKRQASLAKEAAAMA